MKDIRNIFQLALSIKPFLSKKYSSVNSREEALHIQITKESLFRDELGPRCFDCCTNTPSDETVEDVENLARSHRATLVLIDFKQMFLRQLYRKGTAVRK